MTVKTLKRLPLRLHSGRYWIDRSDLYPCQRQTNLNTIRALQTEVEDQERPHDISGRKP